MSLVVNNKVSAEKEQRFKKYKADFDWIEKATHRGLHLGNKDWWGDTELKEQKLEYPYMSKMPKKSTLALRFQEKVGDESDDSDEIQVTAEKVEKLGEERIKLAEGNTWTDVFKAW